MKLLFMISILFAFLGLQGGLIGGVTGGVIHAQSAELKVVYRRFPSQLDGIVGFSSKQSPSELKKWTLEELSKLDGLKAQVQREEDPASGKVLRWRGYTLSQILNLAMKDLDSESRSHLDLIVLKNAQGMKAWVPRSTISKYPLMLAFEKEGTKLLDQDLFASVVPWTSNSKIRQEILPLETFFLSQVKEIELLNSKDTFGDLYLKRRTDPTAIRGERLFVQGCVGCHLNPAVPAPSVVEISKQERLLRLTETGHPDVSKNSKFSLRSQVPKIGEREKKSLIQYLQEFHQEKE